MTRQANETKTTYAINCLDDEGQNTILFEGTEPYYIMHDYLSESGYESLVLGECCDISEDTCCNLSEGCATTEPKPAPTTYVMNCLTMCSKVSVYYEDTPEFSNLYDYWCLYHPEYLALGECCLLVQQDDTEEVHGVVQQDDTELWCIHVSYDGLVRQAKVGTKHYEQLYPDVCERLQFVTQYCTECPIYMSPIVMASRWVPF